MNRELPDVQAGLGTAEEPEINLPTSPGSWKKQENSRKISISTLLTMPKNVQITVLLHSFHMLMLKILQAWLQQYMNQELPDIQAGFRKGRGTRDQNTNICWIIGKAREFQKNIYFCFIDYAKAFDCVDHNKLWKLLKEIEYQTTLSVTGEM